MKTLKALIDNRLPVGFMDINLSKLIHYNQHEGLYLGLGLLTNQKFSETITIGGFWGYGLHDKRAKYGGDVTLLLNRYKDTKLKIGYYDFATETGGTTFFLMIAKTHLIQPCTGNFTSSGWIKQPEWKQLLALNHIVMQT